MYAASRNYDRALQFFSTVCVNLEGKNNKKWLCMDSFSLRMTISRGKFNLFSHLYGHWAQLFVAFLLRHFRCQVMLSAP